jgi:hypothetical protein
MRKLRFFGRRKRTGLQAAPAAPGGAPGGYVQPNGFGGQGWPPQAGPPQAVQPQAGQPQAGYSQAVQPQAWQGPSPAGTGYGEPAAAAAAAGPARPAAGGAGAPAAPEEPAAWYYVTSDRQQTGPISKRDMAGLLRSRAIGGDTLVWHPAMTEWTPADRTELGAFLTA